MRLAGKVAIISGAASGIGAATARLFAREGAKVVIADVLQHEGRRVADGIGASARFEPLEVTKEGSWAKVAAATTRQFGKLDVLVDNADISGRARRAGRAHASDLDAPARRGRRGHKVKRGGEGGIRTLGPPQGGQRFSRPPRSTAPAPLHTSGARDLAQAAGEHQANACRV